MGLRKWSFNKDNDDNLCQKINFEEWLKKETRVSITNYLKVGDKSHMNPRKAYLKWVFYVRYTIESIGFLSTTSYEEKYYKFPISWQLK